MTKKIFQPYEFNDDLKVPEVSVLPTWKATDKRKILRVVGGSLFFGGETKWVEMSDAAHNHDSQYAPKSHTHGDFAAANHDHGSTYALSNHDHGSAYAAKSHSHNYAATNHNHSGVYAAASHSHSYAATNHSHTSIPNALTVSGNLTSTGYMKPQRLLVGGVEVIDSSGFIPYKQIKNHPTYCATDCQCNCTDNA